MTEGKPAPSYLSAAPAPSPMPAESSSSPAYRVTLPEFEGPLDLLLHLCQTHELDILNISVSFIAQKYIEYLELMDNMAVEVAADYLVMAAHLAYLKSRELVPSPEPLEASDDGEEPLDPREELIRRLLEYQKYKNAAENLGSRPIEGRNVFVRGAVLQADSEAGLAEHSVWKLIEHWASTLKKAKPEYTHDVVMDRMSISDRINQIIDLLEAGKGMVQFDELLGTDLSPAELRHKVVVSLLAVLELAKLHILRILQQEATGTFFLAQIEGAAIDDARRLTVTSGKDAGPKKEPAAQGEPAAQTEAPATAADRGVKVPPAAAKAPQDDALDESLDAEGDGAPVDPEFAQLEAELAQIEAELAQVGSKPAEAAEETVQVDAEVAPIAEEPAHADSEPPPVAEELAPSDSELAPIAQEPAPIAEEAPPVAEELAPSDSELAPIAEEPASVAEELTDADSEPPPVAEELAHADSEPAPGAESPDSASNGVPEAFELRPQEEVISAPSPASAATGEEATDGQTQEEQTPREE